MSSHTHTSGMDYSAHQVDEEDDDICPICEGACTCNSKSIVPIPTPCPPTPNQNTSQIIPSPSVPTHSATVAPLKIKLTISAALLTRTRLPTTSATSKSQNKNPDTHNRPKRLGRPPKIAIRTKPHADPTSKAKDKKLTRPKDTPKDTTGKSSKRQTICGKGNDHPQRGPGSGSAISRSQDTDAGGPITSYNQFNPNHDFPTFVSADEFSSANESSAGSSSSSEESELTDFSDSSIADEEENFIRTTEEQRARAHDKARVKRELLGDGLAKRKERQTDWEIRSRTKSVSPSDNGMDVDSDESDDEAEEGAEDAEDNEGEDEDENDVGPARRPYVGIATGWTEDEESSFDADLFFAGLNDSDSGQEPSTTHGQNAAVDTDEDSSSLDVEPSSLTQGVFEITEGWDGSVIFTNGLQDGQGLLDWDFEANAAQLLTEATATSDHGSGSDADADVRMSGSEADMGDGENDSLEEVESKDGDTTEEELVDEDGLPTARAMRLFRPPVAQFYSINPLSTMSPGPHAEDAFSNLSPQPSDILAGHGFADEDEDVPEPPMSEIGSTLLSASSDRGTPRFPLMGTFEASGTDSLRRAVIDGSQHTVPSPFQRSRRRRFSGSVSAQSASRTRDRSLSLSYASFTMSPTHFGLPSLSDDPILTSPCLPLTEPIRLDDVLDTSILDSDPVDAPATPSKPYDIIGEPETSTTDDRERHLQNLSRWDRIPMSTFRHTRESGHVSDGPSNLAYGDIIRSSPFNGVWPSDRGHNKPSGSPSKKGKGKRKGSLTMVISPVILPVRDRDGDHTPNGPTIGQNNHNPLHSKPRKDKESRRDKMHKRKTLMGTAIGRRHQQQHQSHAHHPNSKGRASGSIQRPGVFSGGSVPPLSL
ncbi:hypothetical protein EDB84DRAFT_813335 [Lactarius hengduanensis]|nr:hypothetical protein EDB84DRAFT_813335 [Lactarius hengduanensis]